MRDQYIFSSNDKSLQEIVSCSALALFAGGGCVDTFQERTQRLWMGGTNREIYRLFEFDSNDGHLIAKRLCIKDSCKTIAKIVIIACCIVVHGYC
eukprot:m.492683 g.492683  ORF g.492683 m.492683 type:complete len:95 (+) comp21785_c0_seq5:1458-1742(+)